MEFICYPSDWVRPHRGSAVGALGAEPPCKATATNSLKGSLATLHCKQCKAIEWAVALHGLVHGPPRPWPGLTGGCIACNASNALWGALPPIPSPPEAFRRTGGHRTPGHRGGKDPYRQTPVRRSQSHRRGCGAPIQRLTKGLCLCGLLIALFLCFFKLTALMLPW